VKALNQVNKIKGKINPMMMVVHQMMPKIKFKTPSKLKIKSKFKTVLKVIMMILLKCILRS
jgi:hypothetical protein